MEVRLQRAGIVTMADLIARSEKELVAAFGSIHGAYWWRWLRGEQTTELKTRTRSVGHQHVLPPAQRNLTDARAVLVKLLHKAAARLRQKAYLANGLHVFVRTLNVVGNGSKAGGRWGGEREGWMKCAGLGVPTDDTLTLLRVFAEGWREAEHALASSRLLMVGMTLTDLEPVYGATLPLFTPPRPVQRLGEAMDKVNAAFGRGTMYPASMHFARESAPLRIAFSSIPDLDLPA
jgi:DNA polymerase-4